MSSNGIRHCIVEMQGTKRVEIPDVVMNSIMEIALNKENHPLLIHCNHGKVVHPVLIHMVITDPS
jgi:tyrosine-protein phosphatase SIW14